MFERQSTTPKTTTFVHELDTRIMPAAKEDFDKVIVRVLKRSADLEALVRQTGYAHVLVKIANGKLCAAVIDTADLEDRNKLTPLYHQWWTREAIHPYKVKLSDDGMSIAIAPASVDISVEMFYVTPRDSEEYMNLPSLEFSMVSKVPPALVSIPCTTLE